MVAKGIPFLELPSITCPATEIFAGKLPCILLPETCANKNDWQKKKVITNKRLCFIIQIKGKYTKSLKE
jgi:hypothetical protein